LLNVLNHRNTSGLLIEGQLRVNGTEVFIISANGIVRDPSFIYLPVCWFGCQQDYKKSFSRMWLKFSGKVRLGPT